MNKKIIFPENLRVNRGDLAGALWANTSLSQGGEGGMARAEWLVDQYVRDQLAELQARIDAALAACAAAETGYNPGVGVWISTREIRAHLEKQHTHTPENRSRPCGHVHCSTCQAHIEETE